MSNKELEQFGLAQAMYDYLGKRIATRGRDGFPGDLRAAANAEAWDAWNEHGADRITVKLNGQAVGAVRVNTKEAWTVTDPDAWQVWCQETHHMLTGCTIDLGALTPEQYEEVANYIWDNITTDAVKERWEPMDPADAGLLWSQDAHAAIDPETGEHVPGVEYASVVTGTTIEGFKMDGAKSGAAKKYVPVRTALAGIAPARRAELLLGEETDE